MSSFYSRAYHRSDLPSLLRLAQEHTRQSLPGASYYHPGDVAWQLYAADASEDLRVWISRNDEESIVALAIYEPPLDFQFALRPNVEDADVLSRKVLEWVAERVPFAPDQRKVPLAYEHLGRVRLLTFVLESDQSRGEILTRHGFVPAIRSGVRFEHDLTDALPETELLAGARFRSITDSADDLAARAELHRDAWSIWGKSAFTVDRYRLLRASPMYDPDLDVVLEHEGRLVSYCVCWVDDDNRIGLFEPVGTRPSAARKGFGRSVMIEGLRRLREKGCRLARVGTAVINEPAVRLYTSVGFKTTEYDRFYVLR